MRSDRLPPSGDLRVVGPSELFFSVTDRKGVITAANSVFGRLSAFGREELLSAPHNVIRHPEMPGGAFRLMWDTLLAGRPFAAYVRNLAKDGATYDVFATVTPLGDGFLSVRSAQSCAPLRDAAYGLYREVLPLERARREAGASAAAAAVDGMGELARMLGEAGFPTYEEFMYTALPAEVTARIAASGPPPRLSDGGPVGEVLAAALDVDHGLREALGRLDALKDLVDALQVASDGAQVTASDLKAVTDLAAAASAQVAGSAPVLVRTSDAMGRLAGELTDGLNELAAELASVRMTVMEQRFRIALARLHNDMVISFAIEVLQGAAPPEGLTYVPPLCRTLSDDLDALTGSTEEMSRRLDAIGVDIERAREQLEGFRTFLSTWRIQVPRYGVTRQLGGHVAPIDGHLGRGHGRIAALRELAQQCVASSHPVDSAALVGPVWRIMRATDALLGGASGAAMPTGPVGSPASGIPGIAGAAMLPAVPGQPAHPVGPAAPGAAAHGGRHA